METVAFQFSVPRQQHQHQQRRETNYRNLQTTFFVKSNDNDVEEERDGRKDQRPFSISQSRRSAATSIVATTAAMLFSGSSQAAAAVATSLDTLTDETPIVKEKCVDYVVKDFTITLPSTWNIITKFDDKSDKKKPTPTLFSAIDFNSGSVVSVVQEEACGLNEYAKSSFGSSSSDKSAPASSKICDFLLKDNPLSLFSTETYPKDASKLLIRHDDRDNAVLQGISQLEDTQLFGESKATASSSSSSSSPLLELRATTTIPTGGTYRDTMGLEQPNTIDRKVVAKAVASISTSTDTSTDISTTTTKVVSIWLSAPLDEWQKPVMGTKLKQIWDSVKYDNNI